MWAKSYSIEQPQELVFGMVRKYADELMAENQILVTQHITNELDSIADAATNVLEQKKA